MTVKYETPTEGVALITLNRPKKLNAFDEQMRRELTNAATRASADDAIRAVVVTGDGRAFSAGADVSEMAPGVNVEDMLNTEYHGFLSTIQTMPKPVIAAVNGPAAGIGFSLALTCDLRVMGEDAYLMSAFSNIGLVPDGGLTFLLTAEIGYARAYQLAAEAERIDAQRALNWGLVNRLAPPGEAAKVALDWARSLTERAPIALSLTKRAMRNAAQSHLRNAMVFEAMAQRAAIQTEDCAEGVKALVEKRRPEFKGR